MLLRERTHGVELIEGALIDWSFSLVVRLILFGVSLDGRREPRRRVWRWLLRVAKGWWQWATAVPGDMFWDLQRDLILSIEHGTPRRRTIRVISHQAVYYQRIREMGLEALFALTPPEPCTYRWHDVQRVKWVAK